MLCASKTNKMELNKNETKMEYIRMMAQRMSKNDKKHTHKYKKGGRHKQNNSKVVKICNSLYGNLAQSKHFLPI
jgi:hypothetical protein